MQKHFFAASMVEWRVDDDIERLIRKMKASKFSFNLWHVPIAIDEDYDIEHSTPKVDGAVFLTTICPKSR